MKKLLFLFIAAVFLTGCSQAITQDAIDQARVMVNSSVSVVSNFKDMGDIAMDQGEVSIDFVLKNNGKKTVVVKEMETSCMCTTAEVISGEQTSHKVGMRGHGYAHDIFMAIEPGEEALVKVTFDPNAHGPNGTGINRRSVYLETNSSINSKIKLDFQANVFRTSAELPEQEALSLAEDEFDFGLIKQSGGKVNHEFTLTYNGDEDIKITGVPTSCGCTSASIDKQTLSKGDTAKVIVTFNPNLHAEPEGKFFKTVSILTEPTLGESPEIKIWAEIDLDLGPEAFELQSDHDEDEEEEHDEPTYNSITPAVFSEMLENKDFVLIDVHIPEQSHIAGTDKFIPFDEIENNLTKLPQNKNEKIVVYCRSGSMSRAAAYTLAEMGYSNVYDLAGGKNAYDEYLD